MNATSLISFAPAIPEIFVLSMVSMILLLELALPENYKKPCCYLLSQITLIAPVIWLITHFNTHTLIHTFHNQFILDDLAIVLKVALCLSLFVIQVYSRKYIKKNLGVEFYVLALLSLLGAMILTSANSLLVLYLGLELLSLPLYALIGFEKKNPLAIEAAVKYFITGAVASGMLLYGMSLLYGFVGSIDMSVISMKLLHPHSIATPDMLILTLSSGFLLAGICFKFAAVPFHMWTPDVYQGAPTPLTAMIGTITKLAAVALLLRFLVLPGVQEYWHTLLVAVSLASILVGTLLALVQSNIKRLLGCSTIAHMGFVLLSFSLMHNGDKTALFYTLVYVIMTSGCFGVLLILYKDKQNTFTRITELAGLNERNSWLAFMMLIFLFSMAGIPPFAGFTAKLLVLKQLIMDNHYYIAGFVLIMSVIGAYYYLKIISAMYFTDTKEHTQITIPYDSNIVISTSALAITLLGIFPMLLWNVI